MQIENIVQSLQHSLASIQTIRNRYPPINRLPPEILAQIFQLLFHSSPTVHAFHVPYDSDALIFPVPARWSQVMLVCRTWREIAVHSPKLWQEVRILSESGLDADKELQMQTLHLNRSGAVPLAVSCILRFDEHPPDSFPRFEQVLHNADRIRDLRLQLEWMPRAPHLDLFIHMMSRKDFISLEVIAICIRSPWTGERFESEIMQPLPFFQRECTPRLHTVHIQGYLGWLGGSLRNLRYLCIRGQTYQRRHFARLLDVFELNVGLEDVALSYIVFPGPDKYAVLSSRRQIEMQKLRRLVVENSDVVLYQVLELFLTLPSLSARQYSSLTNPWTTPLDDVQGTFAAERMYVARGRLIAITGTSSINVNVESISPMIKLVSHLENVRELSLGVCDLLVDTEPDVHRAFKSMTGLIKLIVRGQYVDTWLGTISASSPNAFPSLAELVIHVPTDSSGRPILKFIADRKQQGRPIQRLRVIGGRLDRLTTLRGWKASPWKFRRIVPDITFEILDVDHVPLINVPDFCLQGSPIHSLWETAKWVGN